jgi:hypothetical protein
MARPHPLQYLRLLYLLELLRLQVQPERLQVMIALDKQEVVGIDQHYLRLAVIVDEFCETFVKLQLILRVA